MSGPQRPNSGNSSRRNRRNGKGKDDAVKPVTSHVNENPPVHVTVVSPPQSNEEARQANRISRWALVINTILSVFTIALFFETMRANNTSRKSLNLTDMAVKEAKRANDLSDSNYQLAKESSFLQDSFTRKNLDIAETSLQSEMQRFDNDQKIFNAENVPFLQFEGFTLYFEPGNVLGIQGALTNFGNHPISIESFKNFFIFGAIEKYPRKGLDTLPLVPVSFLLRGGSTHPFPMNPSKTLESAMTEKVKKAQALIHIHGEIVYKNVVTQKKRKYKYYFVIKRTTDAYNEMTPYLNENIDLN